MRTCQQGENARDQCSICVCADVCISLCLLTRYAACCTVRLEWCSSGRLYMDLGSYDDAEKWAKRGGRLLDLARAVEARARGRHSTEPQESLDLLATACELYRRAKQPLHAFMLVQTHPQLGASMTSKVG